MLNIAVVDDEQVHRDILMKYIEEWKAREGVEAQVEDFPSGEAFYFSWCGDQRWDVLFLDICMEGETAGVMLAKKLREKKRAIVIIFTTGIDDMDLEKIGPFFENHPMFPEQVNTEFVEILDSRHYKMRVFERGSGETMSCGTGTCAVAVAAVLNGYAGYGEELTIRIRGGELKDTYYEDGTVIMKGRAVHVFDGEIEYMD